MTGKNQMHGAAAGEIRLRIAQLQTLMLLHGFDAALLVQRVDVVYFAGTGQNAQLFVPAVGEPTLFVRKSLARAQQDSPLTTVALKNLQELGSYAQPNQVWGMELDVLPVTLWERYQKIMLGVQIKDISGLIKQLRMVKSDYELEQLHQAGVIMDKVWRSVPELLQPGISEVSLTGKLESVARSEGSQGFIRMRSFNQEMNFAHLMSGANAAVPSFFDGPTGGVGLGVAFPHGPSLAPIEPGMPIVFDLTLAYNGYTVDQTRMGALGKVDSFWQEIYQKSLEIQDLLITHAVPGAVAGDLYAMVLQRVEAMGLSQNFMGFAPDQAPFVAHGVGLELDELPVLAKGVKTVLQTGMVFAAEPKFVFPGRGAVGIENTFQVTQQGLERITFADEAFLEI